MPIDFEIQQILFCVSTNCQTYLWPHKKSQKSVGLDVEAIKLVAKILALPVLKS